MKRTILLLAANPQDTSRLRLDQEAREIDTGLQRSQKRDDFTLRYQWAARPKDVRRAMLENRPNIVHFCGHGEGAKGIAFEDDAGHTQLVSAEVLARFFELFADKLECVVLNACYSELQAHAIAQHIDYVIGMQAGIADTDAIEFAVAFYDALGAGKSIDFAYRLACNAVEWSGTPGHLAPVLISRGHLHTDKLATQEHNNAAQPDLDSKTIVQRWMTVDELIRFGDLTVPCIMCEGDGTAIFGREDIACNLDNTMTEYPQDIKDLIEQVHYAEQERHRRGEKHSWDGPSFGLSRWFATRKGPSETPVLHLLFKPTSYYEFLATNMILDEECVFSAEGQRVSLRAKYVTQPVEWENPIAVFSNQLGVVMSVITRDRYWLAVKRSEGVRWVPTEFSIINVATSRS